MAAPRPGEQPELFQLESHYAKKARRTRLYFAVALIAAIAITAVVAILATRGSNTTATRSGGPVGGNGTNTSIAPTASAAPATSLAAVAPGSNADMTTMVLNGATLPVSRSSGPRDIQGGLASGFAETPLGAALAAVHINVRLDPSAGPSIFTPTAQRQVSGDTASLLASLNASYRAMGGTQGPVTSTSPTAQALGYDVVNYSVTQPVTVHLETQIPGAPARYDLTTMVVWSGSDWKLLLPLPSTVATASDPTTYTDF